jgi:NADPH-dependent 2,4-dienoyl-CoA reductase/sulfur reductase-like enzyme
MTLNVAIVGAGPGGMSAAIEAQRRGARVTLVDEAARPGGQIFRQASAGEDLRVGLSSELKRKSDLLSRFAGISERIDYLAGWTAYALFEGPELHVAEARDSKVLRPDVVLLATGVCERAVPFPGWTLPGIFFAGGAQTLLKAQGIRVGDRVLVAGAGPLPIVVAAQLARAGVRVVAVATLQPVMPVLLRPLSLWAGRTLVGEAWRYLNMLRHHGIELLTRCVPLRADGNGHVDSVLLCRHDGTGRPVPGTERRIGCDAMLINYGFTANSELALMAGARCEYHPGRGGWLPLADGYGRASVDGLLVAGDGAGLRGAWVAESEGRIAGAAAATYYDQRTVRLEQEMQKDFRQRRQHERFQTVIQQLLHLPNGAWGWAEEDTTVCRCECVTLGRIRRSLAGGHTTMNAIKRNTRAGMGWCQGRMCLQNVAAYATGGRPPADLAPVTPRPLSRPASLRALARQSAS